MKHTSFSQSSCNHQREQKENLMQWFDRAVGYQRCGEQACNKALQPSREIVGASHRTDVKARSVSPRTTSRAFCTSVCSGLSGGFQVLMPRIDMVRSAGIPCPSLEIPRGALSEHQQIPAHTATPEHVTTLMMSWKSWHNVQPNALCVIDGSNRYVTSNDQRKEVTASTRWIICNSRGDDHGGVATSTHTTSLTLTAVTHLTHTVNVFKHSCNCLSLQTKHCTLQLICTPWLVNDARGSRHVPRRFRLWLQFRAAHNVSWRNGANSTSRKFAILIRESGRVEFNSDTCQYCPKHSGT